MNFFKINVKKIFIFGVLFLSIISYTNFSLAAGSITCQATVNCSKSGVNIESYFDDSYATCNASPPASSNTKNCTCKNTHNECTEGDPQTSCSSIVKTYEQGHTQHC